MQRLFAAGMALCAVLAFTIAHPTPALASAHCFGKVIVYQGDDAGASISNPMIDYGQLDQWSTQIGHNKQCESDVSAAAAHDPNFNNPTWLCQHIQQQGQFRVSAYAAVGTLHYAVAQSIFITCTGGVKTCICPTGWLSNTSNTAGGVTTDGACKRAVCDHMSIGPFPPNGTAIGTWGFTWGDGVYAWGTSANGGASHCTVTPWTGHRT